MIETKTRTRTTPFDVELEDEGVDVVGVVMMVLWVIYLDGLDAEQGMGIDLGPTPHSCMGSPRRHNLLGL